jgi:pseudoazurin
MEFEMRLTQQLIMAAAITLSGAVAANAADFTVNTLNMSPHGMFQFDPTLLKIQPGDTVHFIAKDKGHDVRSIDGMIPDGAEAFRGEMNKDLTVTLTKPGVYGVECTPHYGMGMVALIVVGDPSVNLAKAEAVPQPGKAKPAFAKLFTAAAAPN